MVLIFRKEIFESMVNHCRVEKPLEACGIIVGKSEGDRRVALRIYRAINTLKSSVKYEIDPETLIKAFKESEEEGLEVLGFYHSHIHGEPIPSTTDREKAYYKGYIYIIVSLDRDEAKGYVWDGERFNEELIIVRP